MKHFKLPENVLVGMLNYLAQRPYNEVAEAIPTLQNLEEIVDAKEPIQEQSS